MKAGPVESSGATRISKSFARPGQLDVEYRGLEDSLWRDGYFRLISLSWPRFIGVLVTGYFGANLFFALAYWSVGPTGFEGMRSDTSWVQFEDAFFFSVQTLATIGYGRISPVSLLPNILVTIEALLGLFGLALMTGLLFARFAKPTARVVFSRNAIIATMDGVPSLVFRVANLRKNQIVEAKISVSALM
ncbi:MAG: ion channel, partial [Bdellovibrionota bacterium]